MRKPVLLWAINYLELSPDYQLSVMSDFPIWMNVFLFPGGGGGYCFMSVKVHDKKEQYQERPIH